MSKRRRLGDFATSSWTVPASPPAAASSVPDPSTRPAAGQCAALQMKGWWESKINVWFPLMYSKKGICCFQNRVIMFCLSSTLIYISIYLWEIYIVPGLVCLFCCSKIFGLILRIYKSLTDTWMWILGLIPRKGLHKCDFPCSAGTFIGKQISCFFLTMHC